VSSSSRAADAACNFRYHGILPFFRWEPAPILVCVEDLTEDLDWTTAALGRQQGCRRQGCRRQSPAVVSRVAQHLPQSGSRPVGRAPGAQQKHPADNAGLSPCTPRAPTSVPPPRPMPSRVAIGSRQHWGCSFPRHHKARTGGMSCSGIGGGESHCCSRQHAVHDAAAHDAAVPRPRRCSRRQP
jgi:hypothetical protein